MVIWWPLYGSGNTGNKQKTKNARKVAGHYMHSEDPKECRCLLLRPIYYAWRQARQLQHMVLTLEMDVQVLSQVAGFFIQEMRDAYSFKKHHEQGK